MTFNIRPGEDADFAWKGRKEEIKRARVSVLLRCKPEVSSKEERFVEGKRQRCAGGRVCGLARGVVFTARA